jgi:hypothetical protein
MADYTRVLLSESTNGRQIKVGATATPGTLIHTAHATSLDEIWLWAFNSSGGAVVLTIEFGGVTDPDDLFDISITNAVRPNRVLDGMPLSGGLALRAFAGTGDVIVVGGYVNRIG